MLSSGGWGSPNADGTVPASGFHWFTQKVGVGKGRFSSPPLLNLLEIYSGDIDEERFSDWMSIHLCGMIFLEEVEAFDVY